MPRWRNSAIKFIHANGTVLSQSTIIPTYIDANNNTAVTNIELKQLIIRDTVYASMSPGEEKDVFTLSNGNKISIYNNSNTEYSVRFYKNTGPNTYTLSGFISVSPKSFIDNCGFVFIAFWYSDAYLNTIPILGHYNNSIQRQYYTINTVVNTSYDYVNEFLGSSGITSSDPYATLPTNDNPGTGYGPFDYTSEVDTPPALPGASAAQCGFVSLWNPEIGELQSLALYLWTSGLFDINTWRHLFSNPMDCILSVGIIPFTPDRASAKEEIVFCGTSHSGVSSYRVPTQMYIIPMGSMHITGMSQGYTDYEPYAKANVFLPYCGTYALSCDEIVDADISLEYHVDIYTGACVAYLTIERTNSNGEQVNAVMYQFTGNMLATIPVTGADHSNFIQSLLFMGAAIGATVATAGASAPEIGGAMAAGDAVSLGTANMVTAGSAINTVMSMKPNVMRSGNLSSTAGLLGKQAPTITITWSNICRPDDEYKLTGMPIHKSGTLSDFKGFTVVSAVHMDNISCTDEERTMIEEQLYKGVII